MKTILAIETSCDETSIAIINNGQEILVNLVSSQIKVHAKHGGVVPEIASRMHTLCINRLIDDALAQTNLRFDDLTAIAVTFGPGLEGSLLVGIAVAKTLSTALEIPLIPVNHLHGHLYAHLHHNPLPFPFIGAIVSGGHTQLVRCQKKGHFETIGKTRDDAAGEAFDKVARLMNLGYPGGPIIEKMAKEGNPAAFKLPIPMQHDGLDFSFSGLKTAMLQLIEKLKQQSTDLPVHDLCASFQATVAKTLVTKCIKACELTDIRSLVLGGGVIANRSICNFFETECRKKGIAVASIPIRLCTDNAAMIGLAAYHLADYYTMEPHEIFAKPSLKI